MSKQYEAEKLRFMETIRSRLGRMERELTEDDFDEEVFGSEIYQLFIPFAEFLDDSLDSNFFQEDMGEPAKWGWMREKFVDLAKFVLQVFEPTAAVVDNAVRMNDYHQLLTEFDKKIMESLALKI